MKIYLILAVIFIFVCSLTVYFRTSEYNPEEIAVSRECLRFEDDRMVPPGSCYCASKLFDNMDQVYDLMDACAILNGR